MNPSHSQPSVDMPVAAERGPDNRMFIVGCVILAAAIIAFFRAFSLVYISSSQHFLLMWLLPLASGFACGCFAGSMKVRGPFGNFVIAATGGFAVFLLSFFLLPKPADPKEWNAQETEMYRLQDEILALKGTYERSKTAEGEALAIAERKIKAGGIQLGDAIMSIDDKHLGIRRRIHKYTYAALAYYMAAYVEKSQEEKIHYAQTAVACADSALSVIGVLKQGRAAGDAEATKSYNWLINDQMIDRTHYYKAIALAINAQAGGKHSVAEVKAEIELISWPYRQEYPPSSNRYLADALKNQENHNQA